MKEDTLELVAGNHSDQEYCSPERVLSNKSLSAVSEMGMKQTPHKHIGALTYRRIQEPQHLGRGTGVLLSPNLVLTAAHNILQATTGVLHKDLKFYPGKNEILSQPLEVQDFFVPKEYTLDSGVLHDYALLRLKTKVEGKDFLELNCGLESKETKTIRLSIYGYPASECNKEGDTEVRQLGLSEAGKILELSVEKGVIRHTISSEVGLGGAPIVMVDENKKITIIGIQLGGFVNKDTEEMSQSNGGRLLTQDLVETLLMEGKRMGGDPIKVYDEKKEMQKLAVKDEASNIFKKGRSLFQEHKWQQALPILKKAIELDATIVEAYELLGTILDLWEREEEGIKMLDDKIAEGNITEPLVYVGIGKLFYTLRKKEEGLNYLIKAKELDPTCLKAYIGLLQLVGRQQAIALMKEAVDHNVMDDIIFQQLQSRCQSENQKQEYAECLRKRVKFYPECAKAYVDLGKLIQEMWCFKKAIELNPCSTQTYQSLGFYFSYHNRNKDQFVELIDFMEEVVKLHFQDVEVLREVSFFFTKIKENSQQAQERYEKVMKIKPDSPQSLQSIVNILRKHIQLLKDPISYYKQAYKQSSHSYEILKSLASTYQGHDKKKEGVSYAKQIFLASPQDPQIFSKVACFLEHLGRRYKTYEDQSQDQLGKNISHVKLNTYKIIADKYQELENYEEAIDIYKQIIQMEPQLSSTYNKLGQLYWRQENPDYDSSIECFKKSTELNSQQSSIYISLAQSYTRLCKFQEGIDCYRKAFEADHLCISSSQLIYLFHKVQYVDPNRLRYLDQGIQLAKYIIQTCPANKIAQRNLQVLSSIQRRSQVLNSYWIIGCYNCIPHLKQDKGKAEQFFKKGEVFLKSEQFSNAIENIISALQLDTSNGHYWSLIARAFYLRNDSQTYDSQRTSTCLKRALEIEPWDIEANLLAGSIPLMMNYQDDTLTVALNYFEKVLKVDPFHKEALCRSGQTHIKLGSIKQASECFTRLMEMDPNCIETLRGMARVSYKNNQVEEAEEYYRKVIKMKPSHTDYSQLGQVMFHTNKKEGIELVKKAIELDFDLNSLWKYEEMLKQINLKDQWEKGIVLLQKSWLIMTMVIQVGHCKFANKICKRSDFSQHYYQFMVLSFITFLFQP